jgi:hypothetical protein
LWMKTEDEPLNWNLQQLHLWKLWKVRTFNKWNFNEKLSNSIVISILFLFSDILLCVCLFHEVEEISGPIVTTTLINNVIRNIGRYLHMMKILPQISAEIFDYLTQLFDFYVFWFSSIRSVSFCTKCC